jgi:hypothetical protein
MRRWLWRHPFLTVGLVTLLLFFVVEGLRDRGATQAAQQLAVPLRFLIIPMYLVWLPLTMLYVALWGPGAASPHLGVAWAILQFIAGLVPYVAADYLLHRWRNPRPQRHLVA